MNGYKTTGTRDHHDAVLFTQEKMKSAELPGPRRAPLLKEYSADFFVWDRCPHCRKLREEGRQITRRCAHGQRLLLDKYLLPDRIAEKPVNAITRADVLDYRSRLAELLGSKVNTANKALAIHRTDVTRTRGVCEIAIMGKGKKARTVFAQRDLVADIVRHFKGRSYLFEHAGKPFNRIYISQRIGVVAKRTIGRDHVSAHCLRHSYATMQYQAKGRIEELAGYLGHASSATTSAYYVHTRMTPEDAVAVAF
jgi:integrase